MVEDLGILRDSDHIILQAGRTAYRQVQDFNKLMGKAGRIPLAEILKGKIVYED